MHRACSRVAKDSLERAEKADLYLVRETGPAAWTVAERGGAPYRVFLGQKHTCTCPCYRMTKDLCVHIVWVLIKKLSIRPSNSLCYQLGMTERELEECLYPKKQQVVKPKRNVTNRPVKQKKVAKDDPCPICLEPFVAKRSPIVYCKYGCGQGMHGHCMEVVARHQDDPRNLRCPMCRGVFSSLPELRVEIRKTRALKLSALPKHEISCTYCDEQVVGSLYKCLKCPQIRACPNCVGSTRYSMHAEHGLAVKLSPDDKWKVAAVQCRLPPTRTQVGMIPKKTLPKIQKKRNEGSALFLEESPQKPKCPICTDQSNYFELECGHLVTTPESTPVPTISDEKRHQRSSCGRLSGRPKTGASIIPPQVVARRLELSRRTPQVSPAPKTTPKPRKKKEPPEPPLEPDIRENGRILGSKVLPIMALLLQRKAEEGEEKEEEIVEEKKTCKRKLTVQCVQLLPDAEVPPKTQPKTRPWKKEPIKMRNHAGSDEKRQHKAIKTEPDESQWEGRRYEK